MVGQSRVWTCLLACPRYLALLVLVLLGALLEWWVGGLVSAVEELKPEELKPNFCFGLVMV